MLVLTREANESVWIGQDVRVVVLGVESAGQVKLGIEAPSDVQILRDELADDLPDAPDE
ncbi:carbon storage regulator [Thioalkalivibrio sp. AKL19]|uniref:carbon storage regulator n=1 Tax=Thioalkalivibrio sp. AKL19 TaxID=1266914 RepID=UPI0004010073|nr:carbon storage regulator [Thioalkalivibrio sp. AKL19]